jgi:hypothetical protein
MHNLCIFNLSSLATEDDIATALTELEDSLDNESIGRIIHFSILPEQPYVFEFILSCTFARFSPVLDYHSRSPQLSATMALPSSQTSFSTSSLHMQTLSIHLLDIKCFLDFQIPCRDSRIDQTTSEDALTIIDVR